MNYDINKSRDIDYHNQFAAGNSGAGHASHHHLHGGGGPRNYYDDENGIEHDIHHRIDNLEIRNEESDSDSMIEEIGDEDEDFNYGQGASGGRGGYDGKPRPMMESDDDGF